MNKKYTVLPEPYYTDSDESARYYDLTLSTGDVVTADLTRADSQGDVYASPVVPNSLGDWINPECLEEVKDWQSYVPDGLTPIEGDEVVGQLYYQDNVVVKGVVERITNFGKILITITEGPEGDVGDKNRVVHQTRILKAAAEPLGEGSPSEESMEALADWERELLSTSGAILLELTEDELEFLANCNLTMVSTHITRPQAESVAAKAQALLPKPKMVTVELTEGEATQAKAGVLNNTTRDGDAAYNKLKEALKAL